jgi:predicted DNA binding CopG/RHH family protein
MEHDPNHPTHDGHTHAEGEEHEEAAHDGLEGDEGLLDADDVLEEYDLDEYIEKMQNEMDMDEMDEDVPEGDEDDQTLDDGEAEHEGSFAEDNSKVWASEYLSTDRSVEQARC